MNSPTPQEQSEENVGAEEVVGLDETDGDMDGFEDGVIEGREEAEGEVEG